MITVYLVGSILTMAVTVIGLIVEDFKIYLLACKMGHQPNPVIWILGAIVAGAVLGIVWPWPLGVVIWRNISAWRECRFGRVHDDTCDRP